MTDTFAKSFVISGLTCALMCCGSSGVEPSSPVPPPQPIASEQSPAAAQAQGQRDDDARPAEPASAGARAPEPAQAPKPANAPEQAKNPAPATPPEPAKAPEPAPASPAAPSSAPQPQAASTIDHRGDIRGLCPLTTRFKDDRACIPAPPPAEGMQIHVGPSRYDDDAEVARYILRPGEETTECFAVITPNDQPRYYQTSVLSGRAGTHHIINALFPAAASGEAPSRCTEQGLVSTNAVGHLPGASKPYMPRKAVPPEYAHVGASIPAHAKLESELHYYNTTDHDILRELWMNVYFVDASEITEASTGIAALGGTGWNWNPIRPGTDKVFTYSCPVRGEGYILSLLGHYHAHGKRFGASITRKAGGTEKVFEMYDYLEPAEFEYNSLAQNPMFSPSAAGALSGRLAVHDGDVLNWECHIVNDSQTALTYTNEVQTGEMCNLWGATMGVEPIVCFLP